MFDSGPILSGNLPYCHAPRLNREFLIWKEGGRGEIGRGRGVRERERERERYKQRDRADNKNPEQSRVAQLVLYKGIALELKNTAVPQNATPSHLC